MKWFGILLFALFMSDNELTIDFGSRQAGSTWSVVNDDVMGGRSSSTAYLNEDSVYFEGEVSLENNGGFASIRGPYERLDLTAYTKVSIRARGTSRDFALSLDTSRWWFRPNYKAGFRPSEDGWKEFTFELRDLPQYRVGKATGRTISEDALSEVIRMGIILYDKRSGPFWLEVDNIRFHR